MAKQLLSVTMDMASATFHLSPLASSTPKFLLASTTQRYFVAMAAPFTAPEGSGCRTGQGNAGQGSGSAGQDKAKQSRTAPLEAFPCSTIACAVAWASSLGVHATFCWSNDDGASSQ